VGSSTCRRGAGGRRWDGQDTGGDPRGGSMSETGRIPRGESWLRKNSYAASRM